MALDIGKSRTGYAVSNEDQTVAFPRGFFVSASNEKLIECIVALAKGEKFTKIVIGLPLGEDNEETPASRRIKKIAAMLSEKTAIPVDFVDEFGSTNEALSKIPFRKDRLKKKGYADAVSAQIILQRYIEM